MREEFQKIARQVLNQAKGLPIQIFIRSKRGVLARFTNNGVHQNGFQDLFSYTVRLFGKDGPVSLNANDFTKTGIEKSVNQLRILVPTPRPLKPLEKLTYPKIKEHYPLQIAQVHELAARTIEKGLKLIRDEKASANGYFSAYERQFYFADSRGLELYHPATAVRFGTTVTRGAAKGYFSFYHPNPDRLDATQVTTEALRLAKQGALQEASIEPGTYECIFSPRAFIELIEPIRHHFNQHLYQEGKSVFSRLVGKRVFSEKFTLYEDVTHPGQFGVPFDVEGNPRRKIALIEHGVLKGLLGEGNVTRGMREHSIYPENLVAEEGELTLPQMFQKVEKGIFIGKLRYHTSVREAELEITGLATAGCLYIERGEVVGRIEHLRYHDSLFSILRSIIGRTQERILLKDGEMGASFLPYFWISRLRVV